MVKRATRMMRLAVIKVRKLMDFCGFGLWFLIITSVNDGWVLVVEG